MKNSNDSRPASIQACSTKPILLIGGNDAEKSSLQNILIEHGAKPISFDWNVIDHDVGQLIEAAAVANNAVIVSGTDTDRLVTLKNLLAIICRRGVRNIVIALSKFDVCDIGKEEVETLSEEMIEFSSLFSQAKGHLVPPTINVVPLDALCAKPKPSHPSHSEHSQKDLLESAGSTDNKELPLRIVVEQVERTDKDRLRLSGQVHSGTISSGDEVIILPGAQRVVVGDLKIDCTSVKGAIMNGQLSFEIETGIDVHIGNVVCSADSPVEVADHFETTLFWTSAEPLLASRVYRIEMPSGRSRATVTDIKYAIDPQTQAHLAAKQLHQNQMGVCNISLDDEAPFEPYVNNRLLGGFILRDRDTNKAVAIGTIHFALRRASNVHRHQLDIGSAQRADLKQQKPMILWFTGLSGSGKSAIANLLEKRLVQMNKHTYTLDGDNIRHGLNKDLGFTDVDRVENIRRIGEVSSLMADAGLIVLVSFISPFRAERELARRLAGDKTFIEIHVDTPLEVAESRDVKGLYKKARAGEIANFTGIDSPYEPPENPEIAINTVKISAADAAEKIVDKLLEWSLLKRNT